MLAAIDGKTARRSYTGKDKLGAIHMVSAWASQVGLSLGQVKTEAKSNEITAIPVLLEILEINGCIVTLDAMGCQTDIADKIADFVLAVKDNQKRLHEIISRWLSRPTVLSYANYSPIRKPTPSMGALKYGAVIYRRASRPYLMLLAGKA